MIVNRRLNLVQPIDTATGTVYLHSVPISREVWESYFLVLAKTYAEIMKQGLTVIAGPPVARLLLKVVAQQIGAWEGENGVERGLLPEIRRLSNVVMPGGAGWETVPYEEVIRRKSIDEDALAEAEGALIFFICASAVLRGPAMKERLEILLRGLRFSSGALTTSLDAMEYAASLPTSMPDENIGAKMPVSSVPR